MISCMKTSSLTRTDPNNKGIFADESALTTAYPTGTAGWYATVLSTDSFWFWDADTNAWVDSETDSSLFLRKDGSVALTANWDAGNYGIACNKVSVYSGGEEFAVGNFDSSVYVNIGEQKSFIIKDHNGVSLLSIDEEFKGASFVGNITLASGKQYQINGTPLAASDVGALANSLADALGDTIYASADNTWAKLSGDTSDTRKFLRTLSVAGTAQAPAWDTVTKTDVGLSNVENTALSTWAGTANITTLGTITTGTWSADTIALNKGGTGQTTKSAAFDALSPMTTLGDLIYGGASGTGTRIAGNTTTTKMFLSQTGDGAASAAPVWAALALSDIPTITPSKGGTGVANNDASTLTITGSYALGLTLSAATALTLPTTGTLATLAGTETLTNKTLTNPAPTSQTLTDGASIAWDCSSGQDAVVTLGGNRALAAPSNVKVGALYTLKVIQDGTGTRTLTWNAAYLFTGGQDPIVSTGGGDIDVFLFRGASTTTMECIGVSYDLG